jgi:hypothetical protein
VGGGFVVCMLTLGRNRPGMYRFLLSVKQQDGSFIMHKGGDLDVR